jgi:hypothetical protein
LTLVKEGVIGGNSVISGEKWNRIGKTKHGDRISIVCNARLVPYDRVNFCEMKLSKSACHLSGLSLIVMQPPEAVRSPRQASYCVVLNSPESERAQFKPSEACLPSSSDAVSQNVLSGEDGKHGANDIGL